MKIIQLVVFISLATSQLSLFPIQDSTLYISTGLVGSLCTGSGYQVIKKCPRIHPALVIGAGFLTTAFTYYLLYKLTPAGRLKRANVLLKEVSRHTLANTSSNNEQLLFDLVHDVYLTDDLPLISAYNHLLALLPMVRSALSLINEAAAQINENVLLQEECDASLMSAHALFKNISQAIKRIRAHKDYLPQLNMYKENILHEKQTIAQQQAAHAQSQIANAQQSSSLVRWLKFIFGRK